MMKNAGESVIILLDFNQIMMTSMHASFARDLANGTFDEGMIRHLALNMIRANNSRFKGKYGRMVICCDAPQSWRKRVFPQYKAHRKAARQKQTHIDWPAMFALLKNMKDELLEYTDYPIIEVDGAEGDDVIAVLATHYADQSNIIISADKDFVQLQAYTNVAQYDPINSRTIKVDDPVRFLEEHILEGDRGDGIPNVLSDADTFVTPGKRQTPMTQARIDYLTSNAVNTWVNEAHQANWKRNHMLIDLRSVPSSIRNEIIEQFQSQSNRQGRRLYEYFKKYQLVELLQYIQDF